MKNNHSITLESFRTLGRSGLIVSPLALGTMTFAAPRWGSSDDVSEAVFNDYVDAGGNFIDTADVYSGGRSEELVGKFTDCYFFIGKPCFSFLIKPPSFVDGLTNAIVSIKVTVMATNTQFSIAVHLLIALGYNCGRQITSRELASSINTSPSFVRRILAKLSKSGFVATTTGKSGFCVLARKPEEISLLEIYKAVDAPQTFAIHDYPVKSSCVVSCNIESVMQKVLRRAQQSFEGNLGETTLAEVIADIRSD